MQVIIDKDTCTFLLRLRPNTTSLIQGDATVNRTYSALTLAQLQALYQNSTGYAIECPDYNATLQACKSIALRLLSAAAERDGSNGIEVEKESG